MRFRFLITPLVALSATRIPGTLTAQAPTDDPANAPQTVTVRVGAAKCAYGA